MLSNISYLIYIHLDPKSLYNLYWINAHWYLIRICFSKSMDFLKWNYFLRLSVAMKSISRDFQCSWFTKPDFTENLSDRILDSTVSHNLFSFSTITCFEVATLMHLRPSVVFELCGLDFWLSNVFILNCSEFSTTFFDVHNLSDSIRHAGICRHTFCLHFLHDFVTFPLTWSGVLQEMGTCGLLLAFDWIAFCESSNDFSTVEDNLASSLWFFESSSFESDIGSHFL